MLNKTSLFRFLNHILGFIFPPLCLHCDSLLNEGADILCRECLGRMELIDPVDRCSYCFVSSGDGSSCSRCANDLPGWSRGAAALDYTGPAVSLITAMKYHNQPHLAKGASALMAAQFARLEWPFPDTIVPVPIGWARWIQRGYNQSSDLAGHLGKIIGRPVCRALKRRSGGFSQAGLNYQQRNALSPGMFSLSKKADLEDKTVLLIDDVMTTGATLRRCAETLWEGFPQEIYVLTVCRAIQ